MVAYIGKSKTNPRCSPRKTYTIPPFFSHALRTILGVDHPESTWLTLRDFITRSCQALFSPLFEYDHLIYSLQKHMAYKAFKMRRRPSLYNFFQPLTQSTSTLHTCLSLSPHSPHSISITFAF